MDTFILTQWDVAWYGRDRRITATTDIPIVLWLAQQPLPPVQTPRYIKRRGVLTLCGFSYFWPNPTYTPSELPGPTTHHQWTIPCRGEHAQWYLSVTDAPTLNKPASSTPYIYDSCANMPPPTGGVTVGNNHNAFYIPGIRTNLTFFDLVALINWSPPPLPASALTFQSNGGGAASWSISVLAFGTGSITIDFESLGAPGLLASQTYQIPAPGFYLLTGGYDGTMFLGENYILFLAQNTSLPIRVSPPLAPSSTYSLAGY